MTAWRWTWWWWWLLSNLTTAVASALEPEGWPQPRGRDAPLRRRPCHLWCMQGWLPSMLTTPINKWLIVYYPSCSFIVVASCLCLPRSTPLNCNNRLFLFYFSQDCRCLFVWIKYADQTAPDFTCVNFTSALIWCCVPVGSILVWFRCCCRLSIVSCTLFSCNCRVLFDTFAGGLAERERQRENDSTLQKTWHLQS